MVSVVSLCRSLRANVAAVRDAEDEPRGNSLRVPEEAGKVVSQEERQGSTRHAETRPGEAVEEPRGGLAGGRRAGVHAGGVRLRRRRGHHGGGSGGRRRAAEAGGDRATTDATALADP